MHIRYLLTLSCFFTSVFIFAQSGNPTTNANLPLGEQYQLMVEKSGRYQQYRVVERAWLDAFQTHLGDSLIAAADKQTELEGTIADQAETINERTTEISSLNGQIDALNEEKDSISLFGLSLSKAAYHTIVWGLIAALGVLLFVILGRSRLAVSSAREAKDKIDKLSSELKESRKQRLAIEQDLRRKLQDERNKNQA
ncbi:MAG: tRNA (guanine-N1)-methyltransferase [Bacteroidota bacterium]